MTNTETAWLAGLLEGEGCFTFNRTARVILGMTDRDVVERAAKLMKSSTLAKRLLSSGKTFFSVALCGRRACDLMIAVLPYMGERRRVKIESLLRQWSELPGIASGERTGQAKLTWSMVEEIRESYALDSSRGEQTRLAKLYGIRQSTLWNALNRVSWRDELPEATE